MERNYLFQDVNGDYPIFVFASDEDEAWKIAKWVYGRCDEFEIELCGIYDDDEAEALGWDTWTIDDIQ